MSNLVKKGTIAPKDTPEIVYMHNAIAEMSIGRKLFDTEFVIHLNGNGLDNRDENLRVTQLWNLRFYNVPKGDAVYAARERGGENG